jgi:hypothetical protein
MVLSNFFPGLKGISYEFFDNELVLLLLANANNF